MTTYAYTLTVNDSECIALKAALELMIQHCEDQLAAGADAPYWAHERSCTAMLRRLYSNTTMTSTSF